MDSTELKNKLQKKINSKKHARRHKSNGKTIEDMQSQIDKLKLENSTLKKAIDPNMLELFNNLQKTKF